MVITKSNADHQTTFLIVCLQGATSVSPAPSEVGGGGAGQSLLVLYMTLKRPTPWLLFKIRLVKNNYLVVEKENFPHHRLQQKGQLFGL